MDCSRRHLAIRAVALVTRGFNRAGRIERPDARSRLTTAYMACNFLCGALGSAGASLAWSASATAGEKCEGGC